MKLGQRWQFGWDWGSRWLLFGDLGGLCCWMSWFFCRPALILPFDLQHLMPHQLPAGTA